MFSGASSFNGDLSSWNVGKVTSMGVRSAAVCKAERQRAVDEWGGWVDAGGRRAAAGHEFGMRAAGAANLY